MSTMSAGLPLSAGKKKRHQNFAVWAVFLCMLPGILHYTCIRLIPSITTAILSFTDVSGLPGQPVNFIGLDNYREFFILQNTRDLIETLRRTGIWGLVVTLAQNIFALWFALLLNEKFVKGRNIYRAVIFMPVILGVTIVATMWKLMLAIPSGLIFKFMLDVLRIARPPAMLNSHVWAFPSVVFVQVWMHTGYTMLIYLAGLQGIPNEVYEAASIDGANEWQSFWHVTLPLLWPIVIVNVLICVIGALQTFELIMVLTQGQYHSSTLGMEVFTTAFGGRDSSGSKTMGLRQGYAAAQSMVLFVVVFVVTFVSQKTMSRMEQER
jgi:raffinose/stachyose/melibiose transport system permease protein